MTLRRTLAAGAACAALALAACGTLSGPGVSPANQAQAIAASWSALGAASTAIDTLAKTGVLHGANATTAATDLNLAVQALQAATAAYNGGDNTTATSQIAAASVLIADIIAISQNPGS